MAQFTPRSLLLQLRSASSSQYVIPLSR